MQNNNSTQHLTVNTILTGGKIDKVVVGRTKYATLDLSKSPLSQTQFTIVDDDRIWDVAQTLHKSGFNVIILKDNDESTSN